MNKSGLHVGLHPTGLGTHLSVTHAAGQGPAILFSLDQNIKSVVDHDSPSTQIVYRTQRLGADTGQMYLGSNDEAHAQGHAWIQALAPFWRQNPATYYGVINEPGVSDLPRMEWLMNFYMGCMEEAQSQGFRITVGAWSTGMPPLSPEHIALYTPMLRLAKLGGHVLELHEYSLTGPMIVDPPNPLILRYRQLYNALPADAQPLLVIAEGGSGAGYGTALFNQPYVDDWGEYVLRINADPYVIGACAYTLKQGESNLAPVLPLMSQWMIDHPTPPAAEPTLEQRVMDLEAQLRVAVTEHDLFRQQSIENEANHVIFQQQTATNSASIAGHEVRITVLEEGVQPPGPVVTTVSLSAHPTTIARGETVTLTWMSVNATHIISNFGATALTGTMLVVPESTTQYTITAYGPDNNAQAGVTVTVNPAPLPIIWQWRGVGVGDNQPLTVPVTSAFEISQVAAAKLFTMPDAALMNGAINAIRAKRPGAFIMARLFFSVNPGSKFSPAEFVAFCKNGLTAAYAAGVRHFEIHNEPNLESEGLGFNWQNGAEFGAWLNGVLAIVRPLFPSAKWGYPGLSPQPNTIEFLTDSMFAAQACDWIGGHAYFQNSGSVGWGITSIDGGMHWKRIRDLAQGKPLIITEFSCNTPAVDSTSKGEMYRLYYNLLEREPGVLGAFCFALSWPGEDTNREGWVLNGRVTGIPAAVAG